MRENHPAKALWGQAALLAEFRGLKERGAVTEHYTLDTVEIVCVVCGQTWVRDRQHNRTETVRDRLYAVRHVQRLTPCGGGIA